MIILQSLFPYVLCCFNCGAREKTYNNKIGFRTCVHPENLLVRFDEREVEVGARDMEVLSYFLDAGDRIVQREELLQKKYLGIPAAKRCSDSLR